MPSASDLRFRVLVLAIAAALGGCAAVDTKTVVTNSEAYMAEQFTPAQLPPKVRAVLEAGERLPVPPFKRIRYRMSADFDEEGRKLSLDADYTITDLGDGYVQSRSEYARNGVPYRINMALMFANIHLLRSQTSFLDRPTAQQPFDTKELMVFDRSLGKPVPGRTYTMEAKTGLAPQVAGFTYEKRVCVAGTAVAASSVYVGLTGNGIPIECTKTGESGVVVNKMKYVWIADLGVAFQTEYTSFRSTGRYMIRSLDIQK